MDSERVERSQPPSLPWEGAPWPIHSQLPLGCVMVVGWEPQDSPEHGHTCRQARALSERESHACRQNISRKSAGSPSSQDGHLARPYTPTAARPRNANISLSCSSGSLSSRPLVTGRLWQNHRAVGGPLGQTRAPCLTPSPSCPPLHTQCSKRSPTLLRGGHGISRQDAAQESPTIRKEKWKTATEAHSAWLPLSRLYEAHKQAAPNITGWGSGSHLQASL